MNDAAYLTIPGDHVDAVTETLLGLYATCAGELGATARAVLDGSDERAELEHARAELHAIEAALGDLGWPGAGDPGAVELVGPAPVLREVIHAALVDAARGVVTAVARYEAGADELPAVGRAVDAVPALFAVFASHESDARPASERGG
jgi:hypothetical protein